MPFTQAYGHIKERRPSVKLIELYFDIYFDSLI